LEEVLNTKEKKRLLLTGAARFNKSPKTGIAFLKEHSFVDETPESLAIFLKNTPRLDKRLLGDFVSKPDNIDILNTFMALFDFQGVGDFALS
jgi:brefeldin A-resistance guanine nucleotide exchange factor 1